MVLGDKLIRVALVNFLNKRAPTPNAIIKELRVHNGNAIADVVAVYAKAHCYEIKGENDTMSRIIRQAKFYNASFTKITLVTTENHLSHAKKLVPDFWGVLIAKKYDNEIVFSYERKARYNKLISKHLALSMLWRSELINIITDLENISSNKRITRFQLAGLIAKSKSKNEIIHDIASSIINRYRTADAI